MRQAFLLTIVWLIALVVAPASLAATTTVRYGPFTVPAASGVTPGTATQVRLAVGRPCVACYVSSFEPNLVYPDGTVANVERGVMLHHAVWTSQFLPDATCGGTTLGLAGQRFFASGNERTKIELPYGYGYRIRWYDVWHMLVDLMNTEPTAQTVYVTVTYTWRWPWENVRGVTPVWLDIDQCGDSEYSIPGGYSDRHWQWTVNVPGTVVAAAGHVHGHGIAVEATHHTQNGPSICRSVAEPDPNDMHHIRSMSTCNGELAHLASGDSVWLHSEYQSSHEAHDVMGIMLMYVHPN